MALDSRAYSAATLSSAVAALSYTATHLDILPADRAEKIFAVVDFLRSEKLCLFVFLNFTYWLVFMFGKFLIRAFFSKLRVVETQHMYDRILNFALIKIILAAAILEQRLEELLVWLTWFTVLGFLRAFTMLCRDRFEYLSFSPNTPYRQHVKLFLLLLSILAVNASWFSLCVWIFHSAGISVLLLLTFEVCMRIILCFGLFNRS